MSVRSDSGDGLLVSRVNDAVRIARDQYVPKFIGFLDEHESAVCVRALRAIGAADYRLFGGHGEAQRVFLGVFPDADGEPWMTESWPIRALTFRFRTAAAVTHRDVLGSLMSLGITRDSVGDILTEPGRAVVFVSESVSEFIRTQLTRIGGEGVQTEGGFCEPLPAAFRFRRLTETVASMRLDGVTAALCRTSRQKAAEWIREGLVALNGMPCDKVSAVVRDGDTLSVRGQGKFRVDNSGSTTRKGRIVLTARQYI